MENGEWRMENWRLEIGERRIEIGHWEGGE